MASVVKRNPASWIDSPHGHNGRQVLGNARPFPPARLRWRIVRPTGMHQAREEFEATPAVLVRVDLAVHAVHSLQADRQFRGCPARPRLAPPGGRPLGTLDDPVLLGATRVVSVHPDAQADQPQRQVGRELAPRAPGPAIVDSEAAGQAPANPGQAELFPHGLEGDLLPSSRGENRSPQHRAAAFVDQTKPTDFFTSFIRICSFASICQVSWARSPGRGGSLVVCRRGRRQAGSYEPTLERSLRGNGSSRHSRRSCTRIRPAPQVGCSCAGSWRSPPTRRARPREPTGASNQVSGRRCRGDETAGRDGGR